MSNKGLAKIRPGVPLLSPLRYPGSKRRLVKYIRQVIEINALRVELFVEPFAGGASVALQLLCNEVVEAIGLSDLDPLIASFWHCVFYDTDWLVDAIDQVEVTLENWKRFKGSFPKSNRQKALKCIFLNRTSFSGILAPSVGPLGGMNQSSDYPISCRFPKDTVIKRIRQASSLRDRVLFVENYNWTECIQALGRRYRRRPQSNIFVYFDPPFYFKARGLYTYFFEEQDHKDLRDCLARLRYNWLLSYDASDIIQRLYSSNGTKPRHIEMLYSASKSSGLNKARELVITNLPRLPRTSRTWLARNER